MKYIKFLISYLAFLLLLSSLCAKSHQGNGEEEELQQNGGVVETTPQNPKGADTQPIVPVKLCLKDTAYPGTFSEIAFCINSKLYAVYSANDGFLTELPPGQYTSNGINSTCKFEVKPNCEVDEE